MSRYYYETIVIMDSTMDVLHTMNAIKRYCQKCTGGLKVDFKDMGVKKLAYEIKGHTEGRYATFIWMGTPEDASHLESWLRINDCVMKFITIKRDEEDIELEKYTESEDDMPEPVESEQKRKKPVDVFNLIFNID